MSIDIPEMQAYLEKDGFEFAGKQFVAAGTDHPAHHPAFLVKGQQS